MDMSRLDVKNYLESIYKIDVAKVNTRIQLGKTKTIQKGDRAFKRKFPDFKVAYVTLAQGSFQYPDLFPSSKSKSEEKKDGEQVGKKTPEVDSKANQSTEPQQAFQWFDKL